MKDGYNFQALCPICNEMRPASCTRESAHSGQAIKAASAICGHSWTLTEGEAKTLLKMADEL